MAWGAIAAAAITAAAQYYNSRKSGSKNQHANLTNMQKQVMYQRQLMDYQHALNSPKRQMQDLQDAGLNPNLVYSGNPAMSTSIPSAPSGGNPHYDIEADLDLVGALRASQEIDTSKTIADVNIQKRDNLKADTDLVESQKTGQDIENSIKRQELKQLKIRTKQLEDYGSDKDTIQGAAVGLGRKLSDIITHKVDQIKKERETGTKIRQDYAEKLAEYHAESLQGRQSMTVNGDDVLSDGSVRLNAQQLDGAYVPEIVIEGKRYPLVSVDKADDYERHERRAKALEAERARRRRNGRLEKEKSWLRNMTNPALHDYIHVDK